MHYVAKYAEVEAEMVTLGGHERMAFLALGEFHILPADLFRLLFIHAPVVSVPEPAQELPFRFKKISAPAPVVAEEVTKKPIRNGRPRNTDPKRPSKVTVPRSQGAVEVAGVRPESIVQAVFLAIKESPRTMHEVVDRVLMAFPGASRGTVAGYVSTEVKEGRAERRDDPETQLTKLYPKDGSK